MTMKQRLWTGFLEVPLTWASSLQPPHALQAQSELLPLIRWLHQQEARTFWWEKALGGGLPLVPEKYGLGTCP